MSEWQCPCLACNDPGALYEQYLEGEEHRARYAAHGEAYLEDEKCPCETTGVKCPNPCFDCPCQDENFAPPSASPTEDEI